MAHPGITQDKAYASRPMHLAGGRAYTAIEAAALPTLAQITSTPSGYADLGVIVDANIDFSVELTRESIDRGLIATPDSFYLKSQKGTVKMQLEEFQPESFSFAAGTRGAVIAVSGGVRVDLGGALGNVERILIAEDLSVLLGVNGQPYSQFWLSHPRAQCGGSVTKAKVKDYSVIPIEYDLLANQVGGVNLLLSMYAATT
jgi:hypothetical protein